MSESLPNLTAATAAPAPDIFVMPASYAQQRIWFLEQWHPGTATFHIPAFFHLKGALNEAALRQSVAALIARHEALRTTFLVEDGQPMQQVTDGQPDILDMLPLVDLSTLSGTERETAVSQNQAEVALFPFNLSQGPLWRFRLLRLHPDEHVLLINLHHIIADGWSMDILCRELSQTYRAIAQGHRSALPDLPLQYADYAIWQQEQLNGQNFEAQLAYWKEKLAGTLPAIDLPADFIRPNAQTVSSQRATLTLPVELTAQVKQFSQAQQVSPFMVLLTLFKLWLHRQTGQADLTVGVPIAGRNQQDIEGTFGCFLNTLALRTQLPDAETTFADLLMKVRRTTLAAYENQDVPFELLLAELQPERDTRRTPLFQVMFNMVTEGDLTLSLPDIKTHLLPHPEIGSKFDLTLYVETLPDTFRLTAVYNDSLFTAVRIQNMLTQYRHLLEQVLQAPNLPLWDYSLVTPAAAQRLPNPVAALSNAWHGSIMAQIAAAADQFTHKDAVIDAYGSVTYQQLLASVNQLAHRLIRNGLQPEDVVAIYGHRSAGLLWAILGVRQAGGAFVILDPTYPPQRLRQYLEIAQISAWIQLEPAGEPANLLLDFLDGQVLHSRLKLPAQLADRKAPVAQEPTTDPQIASEPDALAYLAFTSGSTGQPKAIMGSERPLSHFTHWYKRRFNLNSDDHFSMLSGLAHDPLLRDIITPLTSGATLHIPTIDQMAPGELAQWLADHGITVTHLTPAMSQLLTIGAEPTVQLPALRYAIFGGEPLTEQHVAKIRRLAANVTCVNFYGATETPQAMSYYLLPPSDSRGSAEPSTTIPVGQGIDDVQLLLLNRSGRLAGIGELAEIYVRTNYLAKGYLSQAENGRFMPNPLHQAKDDRVYRTGDLGRYLPNGHVSFVGREDRQVKIRGFRIELAEIEHSLLAHANCREAHVLRHTNEITGEPELVAYIVPQKIDAFQVEDVRQFLSVRLPQYMVPAVIIPLEAWPLTANGKVNTSALPRPDQTHRAVNLNDVPNTLAEKQLVQIWQQVLGLPKIGIHDNFFALGGHSLLAIQLFAQIEKHLSQRLPIGTIFQQPTVAQLAQALERNKTPEKWAALVPMQPAGKARPIFFVHGGAGHVFLFEKLADQFKPDRPFFAFQPNDWEGRHLNPPDVTNMAAQYIQELRQVQPVGPYVLGGFCFGGTIAMEMAHQLEVAGEEVQEVVLVEPGPPALHKAPFTRVFAAPINHTPAATNVLPNTLRTRLGRLKWAVKRPFVKLRNDAKGWRRSWQATVVSVLLAVNQPIPPALRDTYFLHFVSRKSWDNYEATRINGRVRLFLHHNRTPTDPRWQWLQLAHPESKFHILPTNHFGILQLPQVAEVARIIHSSTFANEIEP